MQHNLNDKDNQFRRKKSQTTLKFDKEIADKEALEELKPLEPYSDELKVDSKQSYWPETHSPGFSSFYLYWLFSHCIYYQFFVISRVSFE